MKKTYLILTILNSLICFDFKGQTRYLDPVFPTVDTTNNVVYAVNQSVLLGESLPVATGASVPIDIDTTTIPPSPILFTIPALEMDIFQPSGDTVLERPLIIYLHTGTFAPIIRNGKATGSRNDYSAQVFCNQYAARGYVVANTDYRAGWNPQLPTEPERAASLLKAVYRGVQDAKAAVRFLIKDYENGNTYRIDTSKIIIVGEGTGGHIALAYASIDKLSELHLPKFLDPVTAVPLLDTAILGDWDGYGGNPAYNTPSNIGYSNKVHMVCNMGGMLMDLSWLEAGDVPIAAVHGNLDGNASFTTGNISISGVNIISSISGSHDVVKKANMLGNNTSIINSNDSYTIAAQNASNNLIGTQDFSGVVINDAPENLFPFVTGNPGEGAPWEYFDSLISVSLAVAQGLPASVGTDAYISSLSTNPDVSLAKASAYIDSTLGFFCPRIVNTLVNSCNASLAPTNENFDAGFPVCWSQEANDQFDWSVDDLGTPSGGTGPSDDFTGGGNHMYTEASLPRAHGDTATMYSEVIDISGLTNPELRFLNHMYGSAIGTLSVDLWDASTGTNLSTVFTHSGDRGDQWNEELIMLSTTATTIQFSITAVLDTNASGQAWPGDIAIDEFGVREAFVNDLAVVAGAVPSGCDLTAAENVEIWVLNQGLVAENQFDISYAVNGGTSVIESNTLTVNPGDTLKYVFAATADMSADGVYNVDFAAILATDSDLSDNFISSVGENYIMPMAPTTMGDTICNGDTAMVSADGYSYWYDAATGGNLVGEGDELDVSPSMTTSYYAESAVVKGHSEDFDSYTSGDYIVASDPNNWALWPGGTSAIDMPITDVQGNGGNSLRVFNSDGTDVVMEFGEAFSSGKFYYSIDMYLVGDGYFNFQEDVVIGTTWNMSVTFIGGVINVDIDGASVLTGSYSSTDPAGNTVWNTFEFECDYSTGTWEVFADGVSQGTFVNADPVASVNIYPGAGVEYYLDNVEWYALSDDACRSANRTEAVVTFNNPSVCSSQPPLNNPLIGSWSLNPSAGAIGVGPDSASTNWWASDAAAVTTRDCLFDDSIVFNNDGTYDHYMGGSTWLEPWQAGSPAEGCGIPIAPHFGGTNNYTFANGTLTVSGVGAHVGLAKVHNGGEDGMPANDQIAYNVTFSGASSEIMTIDISFPNAGGTNGLGWWRYVYLKNGAAPPPPPPAYTVTFNVHTDLIVGNVSADGIFIGSGFVGGNDALLLDDSDGDGIWSGSISLDAAGGHFTILNGNCSDWSCKEDISGQPCADASNFNDRNNLLGGFSQDTTLNLQYGSCTDPQHQLPPCVPSTAPYLEDFDGGLSACWTNSTTDVLDWIANSGGTPSSSTGPSDDVTGGGSYIYVETSGSSAGDSAMLTTGSIDISALTSPTLRMYTHMYGGSIGELSVWITDAIGTMTQVFIKNGEVGDLWVPEYIDLSAYSGTVSFTFLYINSATADGTVWQGDCSIDNFEVMELPACIDPYELVASNLQGTSADISWSNPTSTVTSWNYVYDTAGFDPLLALPDPISNTTVSLTGLSYETAYDFYVQSACGTSWIGPLNFTTLPDAGTCGFFTVDLLDSFGDGWNGNALIVNVNGVLYDTLTISSGATATYLIPSDIVDVLDFNYVIDAYATGNNTYPSENSYTVTNSSGIVVANATVDAATLTVPSLLGMVACPPNDLSAYAAIVPSGCDLSTAESLELWVVNSGTIAESAFDVAYAVNGGTQVIESITSTLNPSDTLKHVFATTVDMSADGIYNVDFVVILPTDFVALNNTVGVDAENYLTPSAPTTAMGDTICRGDTALVSADADYIFWYDAATGGNFLGEGIEIEVSPVSTTSYYAESAVVKGHSEDFDALTVGGFIVASDPNNWALWPGGTSAIDMPITDVQGNGGNSLRVFNSDGTDVVMEFGEAFSSGKFYYSIDMYLVGDGYFNFQEDVVIGTTWNMSVTFIGGVINVDIDGASVLTGSYSSTDPAGNTVWNTFEFECDYSTGTWEVFADGVSQGTFVNADPVASVNIYPGAGVEYYLDNVEWYALTDDACRSTSRTEAVVTVNSPTSGTDTQTFCDSLTWIDGVTYIASNNTATYTLTNAVGCDSLVTLDLTILNSFGVDSVTSCNSYTWIDGNIYTSSNNSASYTVQNAAGCDSIVTLNLTINSNQFNTDFTVNQTLFTTPPFAAQFTNTTPNLSNYNFTWDFSDGTILQSNNPSVFHQFLNNGLYDVTLIAENILNGCVDTMYKDDFIFCTGGTSCTHTSTINQTGPITACLSDSIFLTCNTDPTFSYQWRLNGTYIPGAVDTIYYPSQSGNYSVLISQNGCPKVSSDISVTVSPTPNPPFITSSGSFVPCQASFVTLSVPNNFATYSWSSGGTASSEVITSSGSYFVTVTNSGGCASTSLPFNVNASFVQPPDVCIVGVNPQTNFNRVVWEKPVSTAIDSFYVYKETNQANVYQKIGSTAFNDTAIFDDVSSNPAVQAYRYKLSSVDSCGFESSLGDFHKTIHLTINQGIGSSWNLIWSGYEGFSYPSYNIYRGLNTNNMVLLTTIASNLSSYTDLAAPSGQLYYQIEVVSSYSCDPSKSFNSSRSNIVENGSILCNNTGTDVINACDSLTWIDGVTYIASNNTATYTLTNAVGCDSVVLLDLTIYEFLTDFSESSSLFTGPPFVVQFTNNTPNLTNYNFTWDFGDSTIEQNNNTSIFHEYMYNGLYDVTLISEDITNGCGFDTLKKEDLIYCAGGPNLSIIEFSNNINVFPNPTNDNITVSVSNFNGNIKTEVYDLIGNRLQTTNETTISLRDYARGIYVLKVAYGDRVEEVKVIKQ